jgi:signal transduction histidine kinase
METSPRQFSFMEPERTRMNWSGWLSLQSSIFGVVTFVCILIWALTGGTFWPIWVAMGLALPIALQLSVREAVKAPRRWRALAIQGAVSGVIVGLNVFIWALTGGYFWPIWTILGLGLLLALHAIILTRVPVRERELSERVEVLTRTRRGALDVQAAELRRIERDLHDGAQARLVALTMKLGRAEGRLEDQPEIAELVRSAREEASAAIGELRDLARGIAPPVLADRGLEAAVDALGRRSAIDVTLSSRITRRPPPVVETAAYFVVAESLTNVAKHAPNATAHVTLAEEPGHLVIEISDNGPGGAKPDGGGLSGLRQRVQALDGTLAVVSNPGEGTVIRAELPCE